MGARTVDDGMIMDAVVGLRGPAAASLISITLEGGTPLPAKVPLFVDVTLEAQVTDEEAGSLSWSLDPSFDTQAALSGDGRRARLQALDDGPIGILCRSSARHGSASVTADPHAVVIRFAGVDAERAPTAVPLGESVRLRASITPEGEGAPTWLPGPGARLAVEPAGAEVSVRGTEVSGDPGGEVLICAFSRGGNDVFAEHRLTVFDVRLCGETPVGPPPAATFVDGSVTVNAVVSPDLPGELAWSLTEGDDCATLRFEGARAWVSGVRTGRAVVECAATVAGATCRRPLALEVKHALVPSGRDWCAHPEYQDPKRLASLEDPFRSRLWEFMEAMRAAVAPTASWSTTWTQGGGEVWTLPAQSFRIRISATKRPRPRAHLMHYAYSVAREDFPPFAANEASWAGYMGGADPIDPLPINWDHGSRERSIQAAEEMVTAFGMAAQAVLNSNHFRGDAVDMMITWQGSFFMRRKQAQSTSDMPLEEDALECSGDSVSCTNLHEIGRSYGVFKLLPPERDRPHWSVSGG